MKNFAGITDRQQQVLADLIAGRRLGYRGPWLSRVLNNLRRIGLIDDYDKPTPKAVQRWRQWQHLQELEAMDE